MEPTRYRPSNGTEGDAFASAFCQRCEREAAFRRSRGEELGLACAIHVDVMAYGIDEPEYPAEWIRDVEGPRCTAFVPEGEIGRARIGHAQAVAAGQIDLFDRQGSA